MRGSGWLPIIQKVLQTVLLLFWAAMGVALVMYSPSKLYDSIVLPMPDVMVARMVVGVIVALLGLVALVPLPKRFAAAKCIAFSDDLGTDIVHLAPLERTLTREVGALPEVKRAEVFLSPTSDRRGVHVRAEVVLRKAPQISSSAIRGRLKIFLLEQARELLGTEEVSHVELEVMDISVERDLAMEMPETSHCSSVPQTAPVSAEGVEEAESDQTAALEPIELETAPELEEPPREEPLPGSPLPSFEEEEESDEEKEEPQS